MLAASEKRIIAFTGLTDEALHISSRRCEPVRKDLPGTCREFIVSIVLPVD
jgi:hypothetical protein